MPNTPNVIRAIKPSIALVASFDSNKILLGTLLSAHEKVRFFELFCILILPKYTS